MPERDDPALVSLWDEFHTLVNMPSPELRDWLLNTPDGADSYVSEPGVEPHALGERVLQILDKRRVDLTDADVTTMRQVTNEISELLANPPADDVNNGPWRDSLRTLGHDPTRADSPRGPDLET
ncbi:MAG TPA: DUF3140 domain-containing protein [Micromonosporaceae bacterium]